MRMLFRRVQNRSENDYDSEISKDLEEGRAKQTTSHLRRSRRSWATTASLLVTFALIFEIMNALLFYSYETDSSSPPFPPPSKPTFDIIINTYFRPELLQKSIAHYSSCGNYNGVGIDTIFVVSPEPGKGKSDDKGTRVVFSNITASPLPFSLNNRFLPLPFDHHHDYKSIESAVFSVDDDVLVSCSSLFTAFEAWRSRPNVMVGFFPRRHEMKNGKLVYRSWSSVFFRGELSIILTKAAFLNRKYLDVYSGERNEEVRDYVDRKRNCEDIAMSLVVLNATRVGPLYAEGVSLDRGVLSGISTGGGKRVGKEKEKKSHFGTRSQCLNGIIAILDGKEGEVGLRRDFVNYDLGRNSVVRRRFWWMQRPSSVFEWISVDVLGL